MRNEKYRYMRKRELLQVIERLEASHDYWVERAKELEISQGRCYPRELAALEEHKATLKDRDDLLMFFYPSIPVKYAAIDWEKLSKDKEAILRTRQVAADKRTANEWNL